MTEFVPSSHRMHLVRDLVQRELDFPAIHARYGKHSRSHPLSHPRMMTALVLYAGCMRRSANACRAAQGGLDPTSIARPGKQAGRPAQEPGRRAPSISQ